MGCTSLVPSCNLGRVFCSLPSSPGRPTMGGSSFQGSICFSHTSKSCLSPAPGHRSAKLVSFSSTPLLTCTKQTKQLTRCFKNVVRVKHLLLWNVDPHIADRPCRVAAKGGGVLRPQIVTMLSDPKISEALHSAGPASRKRGKRRK